MAKVVMYSADWCPYCRRAEALLQSKRAEVEKIDVDAEPQRRREMMARSGRRTVPQIWIGATHVGGCDELYDLEREGRLDALLGAR